MQHRRLRIALVCFHFLLLFAGIYAQPVRLDTVRMNCPPMMLTNDPASYSIHDLANGKYVWIQNDLFRGYLFDQQLTPIAIAPPTATALRKQTAYSHFGVGIVGELAILSNGFDLCCLPQWSVQGYTMDGNSPLEVVKLNEKLQHGDVESTVLPTSLPLEQISPDEIRLYGAVQIRKPGGKELRAKRASPFHVYSIKRRQGKWSLVQSKLPKVSAIHPWARKNPLLYGFTDIAVTDRGIWRADYLAAYVYLFDRSGHLLDSVKMTSPLVAESEFVAYAPDLSIKQNIDRGLAISSFYFGLLANESYLVRSVHEKGGGRRWIIHQLATQQTVEVVPPPNFPIVFLRGSVAWGSVTLEGDQLSIATIDLNQFF